MQVVLATTEGLGRKFTITVPAEESKTKYQNRLKDAAKNAKVDGFRKGKVPVKLLEERYRPSVWHEVVDQLIKDTLPKAFEQEKLQPAGMPSVDSINGQPGEDFVYEASFEVYPEINLKELTDVEIEQVSAEVTDQDVENLLKKLQQQHANWVEVDRAAEEGDQVTIDFEGFVDGEAFEGGKAESVPLVLGSKTMIPGFEDGLVGAKAGDELELNVTFPKQYHAEKLAGKAAVFKTKVHKVCAPELPELDDAFAEKFAVKEGGIEKLKDDMRKHMQRELGNVVKSRNKEAVFNELLKLNEIEVPKALIENEMKNLHAVAHQQQGHQHHDHDHELSEAEKQALYEPAKRRVRLALLINEVINAKEIKADSERVKALVEEMAASYDNPEEFTNWFYSDRQQLSQMETLALEEQVIEELLNSAKVNAKTLSYEEAIQPPAA